MDEIPDASTTPYPSDWLNLLVDDVDFERAFDALEGYTHFHSETLRGKVRSFQLRTEEANWHFRRGRELYARSEPSEGDSLYLFYGAAYRFDNAVLQEAANSSSGNMRRTDLAVEEFLSTTDPGFLVTGQIRSSVRAYYRLIRRDSTFALAQFKDLMRESHGRLEDQQVTFYTGAAAAAWELGFRDLARRHYESASLGVNMLSQPLKVGLFCARLYALARHWGLSEARDWMDRIERLDCPEPSREVLRRRGELFLGATAKNGWAFIS